MEMPLSTHQLRVFVVIARYGNMRRAGSELGLSPSALSHTLKALENELGCKLFERTSRSIRLTHAGEKFLPEATFVLQKLENIRHSVQSWSDWRKGVLNIGASASMCQYILPSVIREFKECFPEITIKIIQGTTDELHRSLIQGKIDLGIGPSLGDRVGIQREIMVEDELAILMNPRHPWVTRKSVPREEIQQQRYILPESSSITKGLIDDYFRVEGLTIEPFIEINNPEVIKQLVRLDIGISVFPLWIAEAELESGLLVGTPLGKRPLKRAWTIDHVENKKLSFPATLFMGICRDVAKNRVRSRKLS